MDQPIVESPFMGTLHSEIRSPKTESGISPAFVQNDDQPISDFGLLLGFGDSDFGFRVW
jgi:hypothetical protein